MAGYQGNDFACVRSLLADQFLQDQLATVSTNPVCFATEAHVESASPCLVQGATSSTLLLSAHQDGKLPSSGIVTVVKKKGIH
jgi:hypothetical protein